MLHLGTPFGQTQEEKNLPQAHMLRIQKGYALDKKGSARRKMYDRNVCPLEKRQQTGKILAACQARGE